MACHTNSESYGPWLQEVRRGASLKNAIYKLQKPVKQHNRNWHHLQSRANISETVFVKSAWSMPFFQWWHELRGDTNNSLQTIYNGLRKWPFLPKWHFFEFFHAIFYLSFPIVHFGLPLWQMFSKRNDSPHCEDHFRFLKIQKSP